MAASRAYLQVALKPLSRSATACLRFPFPALVCDVGGTNLRVAIAHAPGDLPHVILKEPTSAHRGLDGALAAAAKAAGATPRSVLVCAAGPIEGTSVRLTNADWAVDGPEIARRLGLEQGLLLNDFEAQAVALPHVSAQMSRMICRGTALRGAPMLVLGPGTGLGAAALLRADGPWVVATTEAGHADFGPASSAEEAVWPHLERVDGRVTFESVLSGPGLARLHAALCAARGLRPANADAAQVQSAAQAGDAVAAESIRWFWRLVARCAGDLALVFLARGGVALSGGVLPRLVDWLDPEDFRRAFTAKAPMQALLADIPVRLILDPDVALSGMSALAAAPDKYAIDYAARAWRPVA